MPANLKATIDNFVSSLQESRYTKDAPIIPKQARHLIIRMLKIANQYPVSMRTVSKKLPFKEMPE